jgi:hypothetical protein
MNETYKKNNVIEFKNAGIVLKEPVIKSPH